MSMYDTAWIFAGFFTITMLAGAVFHLRVVSRLSQSVDAVVDRLMELELDGRILDEEFLTLSRHLRSPELEQRSTTRYDVTQWARVEVDGRTVEGVVQNISRHGLFFASFDGPETGENVTVYLKHPDAGSNVSLRGRVVREVPANTLENLSEMPGVGIVIFKDSTRVLLALIKCALRNGTLRMRDEARAADSREQRVPADAHSGYLQLDHEALHKPV